MDNMLEMYLYETNTLLEQLDELLIEAEKNEDFTTNDVNEIFRIMHTIKGSSAMMEFSPLMEIAHHIEDLFFYIRENGLDAMSESHKNDLFNLMFQSTDALRGEVEKLENDEPLSTNIDSVITDINSFLEKISGKNASAKETGGAASDAKSSSAQSGPLSPDFLPEGTYPQYIKIMFEEGCGMENLRAFMVITALQEMDIPFLFYPADVESNSDTIDFIQEHGFYVCPESRELTEVAVNVIKEINSVSTFEVLDHAAASAPAENTAEKPKEQVNASHPSAVSAPASGSASSAASSSGTPAKQSLISVSLSKLDSLMAIVGEIVITESMVTSSPEIQNLKLDSFLKSTRQLRKLTDDLQDIAMSLRMVPVSGTFQKMNRIVRDMKKKLNKDVRLTIEGENTEVDKSIVDSISDPIMHIVRNSMDHGIEPTTEERIAAGKPAQAEIVLSAMHTGSEVIISVRDDGQRYGYCKDFGKGRAQRSSHKACQRIFPERDLISSDGSRFFYQRGSYRVLRSWSRHGCCEEERRIGRRRHFHHQRTWKRKLYHFEDSAYARDRRWYGDFCRKFHLHDPDRQYPAVFQS